MNYSMAAFQEPRGVMRILKLIFAIVAFATTTNFSVTVHFTCNGQTANGTTAKLIEYPFRFNQLGCVKDGVAHHITADLSSDAQFYVATGVLSFMYCVFIIAVYAFIDEFYKSKSEIPLADFMLTTVLAIFWLSGSAAWSNGTNALKQVTDAQELTNICTGCTVFTSSFSRLNISLIIGFLNFFLWASDLWFLYKETIWFQGRQANNVDSGTPTI